MTSTRRPRDPEGRRQAILDAALELVIEVGINRTSHRAIADRAGVSLGSTTYYFPTLPDLVSTALEQAADKARQEMCDWRREMLAAPDLAATLTRLALTHCGDRDRLLLEYELYLAAVRSPELRELATLWLHELRTVLTPLAGAGPATAIGALLDGFILQAVVTGEPPDPAILESALAALIDSTATGPADG